jgi:hypothetical protein
MKMLIGGLAAAWMATAVLAQTPPADTPPADPMANTPATMPPASTMTPTDPVPAASEMAPAADTKVPMLVEKNGKWWNGDRLATKSEIAEYRRTKPQ